MWTVEERVTVPWTEDSFDAPLRSRCSNDDGHATYDDDYILNIFMKAVNITVATGGQYVLVLQTGHIALFKIRKLLL